MGFYQESVVFQREIYFIFADCIGSFATTGASNCHVEGFQGIYHAGVADQALGRSRNQLGRDRPIIDGDISVDVSLA